MSDIEERAVGESERRALLRAHTGADTGATGRYTVQVVDDHHMMRFGLMALASTASHLQLDWIESVNLDEALHTYRQTPAIDLVLLDLNLPDSKGLQGVRRFLAEFPQVHLAIFSAGMPFAATPAQSAGQGLQARAAMLNPTQHKVLELVLAGMSNQEIASECKLALGTVKNTVSSIMLSLDVRSRSHLISVFR